MAARRFDKVFWGKTLIFLLALAPLLWLVWDIFTGQLGPDPGKTITRALGLDALKLLVATLAMTPLRRMTGWPLWLRSRRMLGLYTLFYASLHVLCYLQFIAGWQDILNDVAKRPYITVGFAAFVMLIPLGVTSTRGMMRRLGKNWVRLHRLIYPLTLLVWIHFLWQARSDIGVMVAYGAVLGLLLLSRVWWAFRKRSRGALSAGSVASRS